MNTRGSCPVTIGYWCGDKVLSNNENWVINFCKKKEIQSASLSLSDQMHSKFLQKYWTTLNGLRELIISLSPNDKIKK